MSPTKIQQAKTMEKCSRPDDSHMYRMMLMLETLGNQLGKVETEQSVAPVSGKRIYLLSNQGQGFRMSS